MYASDRIPLMTTRQTSETGYIQRRLVKAMEDIRVMYDGTVRNSNGSIIQFLYGEDGMDACFIESQKLDHLRADKKQLDKMYKYDYDKVAWNPDFLAEEVVQSINTSPEMQEKLNSEFAALEDDLRVLRSEVLPSGDAVKPLPSNIDRLILNSQTKFHSSVSQDILTPSHIIDSVKGLVEKMKVVTGTDKISVQAQKNATLLFFALVRCKLASKRVLRDYKLTKEGFDYIIGELESRFRQAVVQPGEMIGIIAAQSIGEPATQVRYYCPFLPILILAHTRS